MRSDNCFQGRGGAAASGKNEYLRSSFPIRIAASVTLSFFMAEPSNQLKTQRVIHI
jgi:hypothetical protein